MRTAMLGLALTLTLARGGEAQLSGGQWRVSPQGSGRTGVEVKPTVVVSPGMNPMLVPSQPVAFNFVPAILMSDGSIFANFGFGFEPVLRPCSTGLVLGQPGVIGGNGVVLAQPTRPTYTQPVPAQMTASQQMLAGSQRSNGNTMVVSQAAQLSCFGRDAAGRVFVLR